MSERCNVHWLGRVPYKRAWQLQESLAGEIAVGQRPATLLLLEHPHTYTFGRRGQASNLLWDETELARRGISVHWVDRGGDVTYHGPGQLVGYPLLPLAPGGLQANVRAEGETSTRPLGADYIGYLRRLEQALIEALARMGFASTQVEGLTGVWVELNPENPDPELQNRIKKLASIGVKVDVKGVSRHGFALNVDPDMGFWEGIIGCGLQGYHETSLAELGSPVPDMRQVIRAVIDSFADQFDYQIVEAPLHSWQ